MTQKNDDIFRLRNLAIDRDDAKDSFKENFAETKNRLKPANLIKGAKETARQKLKDRGQDVVKSVRSRPALSASVLAAAALTAFHKPIGKFIGERLEIDNNHSNDLQE